MGSASPPEGAGARKFSAEDRLASLTGHDPMRFRTLLFLATLIPLATDHLRGQGSGLRIVLHQAEPVEARDRVRHGEADLARDVGVNRVQTLGPIERDASDPALDFVQQRRKAHGSSSRPAP